MDEKLITPKEMDGIRAEYQRLRDRNAGDAVQNPDALAALALVQRLLEEANGWAHAWEEDVVFFGGSSPDEAAVVVAETGDLDLEELLNIVGEVGGLARREVRAYQWQVLSTPDIDEEN